MVAPADDAEHADADDDDHELLQPGAEVGVLARARRAPASFGRSAAWTAWNSRIGMRAMKNPTMKSAAASRSALPLREHEHAEGGRVAQRLRGERSEEEQREVGRELRPLGVGARARGDRAGRAATRATASTGGIAEREPVPDEVVDAGDVEHDHRQDAEDALGAEDHAVRTEATVARERAARDVLHRVGAERDHEADEQDLLAVEQAVGERANASEADDRERHERPARAMAPAIAALRTTGPPPMLAGAAVGDRPADLLLERQEEPGRDDEHEDPQAVQRRVLGLRERP